MRAFLFNTLWDAFLAAIPVALGYMAASLSAAVVQRRRPLQIAGLGVLLLAWLAFLPNASYVITQWRHLLEKVDADNLALQAQNDPQAMFAICTRALFYFCYSGFGVLALTLAVRPIEGICALGDYHFWRWRPSYLRYSHWVSIWGSSCGGTRGTCCCIHAR